MTKSTSASPAGRDRRKPGSICLRASSCQGRTYGAFYAGGSGVYGFAFAFFGLISEGNDQENESPPSLYSTPGKSSPDAGADPFGLPSESVRVQPLYALYG